ncbi:MAG: hypothetical protein AAGK01_11280 [Pseudomonadota bacterium]
MSATAIGMLVGTVAVPVIIVVVGFVVAKQMNKNRSFEDQVKWPIGVGIVLALLMLPSLCSGDGIQSDGQLNETKVSTSSGPLSEPWPTTDEIDVESTINLFSQGLMPEVLSAADAAGLTLTSDDVPIIGRVHEIGDVPILQLTMTIPEHSDLIYFIGPKGGQQTVVYCGQDIRELQVITDVCAAEVNEAFGLELDERVVENG